MRRSLTGALPRVDLGRAFPGRASSCATSQVTSEPMDRKSAAARSRRRWTSARVIGTFTQTFALRGFSFRSRRAGMTSGQDAPIEPAAARLDQVVRSSDSGRGWGQAVGRGARPMLSLLHLSRSLSLLAIALFIVPSARAVTFADGEVHVIDASQQLSSGNRFSCGLS